MSNVNTINWNGQYALLDGASGTGFALSKESQELQKIIFNRSKSQIERLEAYEDIFNLEVGDTGLSRARNIERESGLRQIFLKFEGGNPTGTQKDRIAFTQCLDALRRGFDTITAGSCGNYGVSLGLAASIAGLHCIICIPENYHTKRYQEINNHSVEIIRTQGDYEAAVGYSRNLAEEKEYYDANPGGNNTHLQIVAYSEIANEIYDVLRDAPRAVAVPVSNGTLLAGIYRGFMTLYKRGKTSRIPWIIAGSSYRKNPIVYSFKKGLSHCTDLEPRHIHETKTNEPLINWHSYDGDEALTAIRASSGWAEDISDSSLNHMAKILRDIEGLNVLSASTAGLVALINRQHLEPLEGDRYVAIITGRK